MKPCETGGCMLEKGALTGISVLDLTRLLPGPFASMTLADQGAHLSEFKESGRKGNIFSSGQNC